MNRHSHRHILHTSVKGRHIAIITDAWTPQINGVVTAFTELSKHLEKKEYTVSIIHPGLFHSLALPHYTEVWFSLDATYAMGKKLKKLQPDYIHIATEGPLGLAARSYCVNHNIPFTSSYHTHFPKYAKSWRLPLLPTLGFKYLAWFHSAAQHTLVTTEPLKQELEAHRFKHLKLWPLGVDTDLFMPHPALYRKATLPRPIFGYLGRLAKEKNVEAFLKLDLPGTKLIIGDGPMRDELEDTYTKNTHFVGYQRGKDLVKWLSMCDVCVMPSVTETFGLVIIEALACGLPVAAYDVTGPREIITNGVDGVLDKDLGKAAHACLTLSHEACRKTALKYSWEASTNAFLMHLAPILHE